MNTTSDLVCRHRHPLEWLARIPRTHACADCRHLVELVLTVTAPEGSQ